jgi:tRNA A-37 threonylcarbamoyl transferase component Bud32
LSNNDKQNSHEISFVHKKNCSLLYNPELLQAPEADLLSEGIFKRATEFRLITTGGRGHAWFVSLSGLLTVFRKYRRGGLLGHVIRQTYFSFNLENTRSIKEWRILHWMHEQGLSVPLPIAASVCRWPIRFSPLYRAQILVSRIPNTQTLDQLLAQQSLEVRCWQSVGQCISRLHKAGVYHADLNANNILIDDEYRVYLIDFDKCERLESQQMKTSWMQNNLQRLKRSFIKQQGLHHGYHFTEENWQMLLTAYGE